ncbi:MAG: mannose-1-phosphate guanyltransferase [Planctomycetales bacterium 12-60-4]|nr:MAG: mannose-1-phosphate guanyltransferase [Planctomycetales bacterium 12-60-4]
MLHAVVMAGGSGTRFWPQSRQSLPKQFLKIGTVRTLIQETVDRCLPLVDSQRLWIVTGAAHAAETQRQLPDLRPDQILVEPCPRNTAPCIGLAAIRCLAVDPDATMLVMPADHVIQPPAAFRSAVKIAVDHVQQQPQSLVLFGVVPSYAATGFGYIQRGAELLSSSGIHGVAAFREKPDADTAAKYVAAGDYYWNCGIFVWQASTILAALAEFQPEMHARLLRLAKAIDTPQWAMTSISIDYAVLERSASVQMLPATFAWDDVGSWQAMARLIPEDAAGNTVDGLHAGIETERCIIRSTNEHLVATVGVHDLIVVHTPTATLVANRSNEAAVKSLLDEVRRRGLDPFL